MMQGVSRIAIAGALMLGLGGTVIALPANAKKEKPAEAAPADGFNPKNLSNEARPALGAIQTALAATPPDYATAKAKLTEADGLAKNASDSYIIAKFRLQVASGEMNALPEAQRNDVVLAQPLETLIANPITPKAEKAQFTYIRGNLAYNQKDYAKAAQLMASARDLGYQNADLPLNLARAKVEAGDVAGGVAELDTAVKAEQAAGRKAPEAWYKYAVSHAIKANLPEQTNTWTQAWLANYGTKENWRTAIYTFGFSGPGAAKLTDRNRIDLYRLMRVTNSLAGAKEYIDYADAANKTGLPTEAKTVIKEGFDSKVIPAGNATATDMAKQASESIASDKPLAAQEKAAAAAPKGDLASQAGDAYLGERNYAKAAELYKLAATKGVNDNDRLNLHLGIAQALGGDKEGARATLTKVTTAPNADIAKLWLTWLASAPVAA
ncbi:tetratricopeptide repeat protein [Sphingomonas panacis]|nr:tetratricopeptide repeat protein [Sphingomonas panacis]